MSFIKLKEAMAAYNHNFIKIHWEICKKTSVDVFAFLGEGKGHFKDREQWYLFSQEVWAK